VFTAENGYVARARVKHLRKYLPVSCNHADEAGELSALRWSEPLQENPALRLAGNVTDAMRLMQEADVIFERLPKLDCGSCGAPTCRALAEDIVRGLAREDDCIFRMRERLQAQDEKGEDTP